MTLIFNRGPGALGVFWIAYSVASFFLIFVMLSGTSKWDFRILTGLFFTALHAGLISAFAVALATRFSLIQSSIGTAAFFLIGHASGTLLLPFRDADRHLSVLGLFIRAVLPDLDQFNITDALATAYLDAPTPIPWDIVAGSTVYAGLYGAALLALAAALFANRELS